MDHFLKSIVDNVSDGLIYQEADGRIKLFNRSAQKILGVSAEKVQNQTSLSLEWHLIYENGYPCPEDEHPSMITLRTGQALNDQIRGVSRPGQSVTWLSINTRPIFSPGTELPEAVVISFIDVTRRRRAEEDFERFFQLTPDLACIASTNGFFLKVNPAWQTTLGFSEEELLSTPFLDFIHPDDRANTMKEVKRQLAGQETISFVNRYRCKDDGYRWLEWRATPAKDQTLLFATARDITDRKWAEEQLKRSEAALRSLYHAAPIGIGMVSFPERTLGLVNDRLSEMTGYSRAELSGMPARRLYPSQDEYERVGRDKHSDVRLKGVGTVETRWRRKDGSDFDLVLSSTLVEPGNWEAGLVFTALDISQRKRAEEELRSSEEHNRQILHTAMDGFWRTDVEGRILEVNEAYCRMSGYQAQELLTMNIHDLEAIETAQDITSRMRDLVENGEDRFESRHRHKNGSLFDVEVSLQYKQGKERGECVVFLRDITQRNIAANMLRESEERYRSLFDGINVGVAVYEAVGDGEDFIFKDLNRGGETIDRQSRQELIGKSLREARPGVEDFGLLDVMRRVWRMGKPERLPVTLYKDQRISSWYENYVYKLPSGEIVVIFDDVTELKRAEEDLRRSMDLLDFSQRLAKIGGWVWDVGLQSMTWTEETYRLHGYEVGEIVPGLPEHVDRSLACYDAEDRPVILAAFHRCIEEGYPYDLEFPFTTVKGNRKWIRTMAKPVMQDGRVIRVMGNIMDITERKRTEEETKRLENQLRQAHKMEAIGTLAGGIAHDFNNILGAVLGFSEIAYDDAVAGQPNPADIEQIMKAAQRAKDLVKRILTFSHKNEPALQPFSINRACRKTQSILERTIPKMIAIECDLDEKLPPISADPTQMEQVLLNLCSNAADAMPDGGRLVLATRVFETDEAFHGVHPEVPAGKYILLTVSDTGCGMDRETREHIFEPFFTTKGVGKGTGLGLSTVYGIVITHGGFIYCYSEPDQGTTFKIYLPVLAQEQSENRTEALTDQTAPPTGTETILLVDDEDALRTIGARILREAGYLVREASSGEEALQTFAEQPGPPDLMITDLGMPGMGGHKAMLEILTRYPATKIVITSGYADPNRVKASLDAGASAYMAKPFKLAELLTTVRNALDKD